MKILALDPSGNFSEGNGTTGWAILTDHEADSVHSFGHVRASKFKCAEAYWDEVVGLIVPGLDVVVYETYRLQAAKAKQQIWSELETPQLIGIIRHYCFTWNIPCIGQDPSIKPRFSDQVLVRTGIASEVKGKVYVKGKSSNVHQRDAIRHGLYYLNYGRKRK